MLPTMYSVRGSNSNKCKRFYTCSSRRPTYRLYLFKTGSSSSLAMRSEVILLGAILVSWNASHDVMASTAEIVNEDKRIVSILSVPGQIDLYV